MTQVVKVFKSTFNDLPEQSTPKSGAKDIRADISLIKDKFIFGGKIVFVKNGIETGNAPMDYVGGVLYPDYSDLPSQEFPTKAMLLNVGGRVLIPSGLKIQLPDGYSMDVRPRSGLALKYGITCLNTPGLIDEDYRGDVGVILINHGFEPVVIVDGDRIAQIKVNPDTIWVWEIVDMEVDLSNTVRGEGGFNSSGTK